MPIEQVFSKHLRFLRESRGLTQEHLAEKAGLDYKYIQMLEGKKAPSPTLRTLEKLAIALGLEPWELIRMAPPLRKGDYSLTEIKGSMPQSLLSEVEELIRVTAESTIEVFHVATQLKVTTSRVYYREASDYPRFDIGGLMPLVARKFSGCALVCFPLQTYLNVLSKFHGLSISQVTPETVDGAAEFANIIFGRARQSLNEKGYGMTHAFPETVVQDGFASPSVKSETHPVVPFVATQPAFIVPLISEAGEFFLVFCIGGGSQKNQHLAPSL